MPPKSRMGANGCTGGLPYGYACAMPVLNGWTMDRRGEMAHFAVRCRLGRQLTRAVLPGALGHTGEAAYIRGDLLDLRRRLMEGRSA